MRICRMGLVGAGGVAQRHARVLSGFDDVQLVGVTDVLPEAATRLADSTGARVFPDVAALLSADLDAVYVCVPPFAHGAAEEAVLDAGLALFVEKPLALDRETASRINRLAGQRGVVTAVGHFWRYLAAVEQARHLLADRPVRLVAGAWLDKVPPVGWWPRRDRSGGPVVEQASHVLDLARHLVGEVSEVWAVGNGTPPEVAGADVDGATAATLRFATGAVGTLTTTCTLGWKHRAGLEVYADGLALSVGEDGLLVRDTDGEHRIPGDLEQGRTAVDRAFVDAVRGIGDDVRGPYPEALRTHLLALAVAESAATGQPVRVPSPEPEPAPAPEPSQESEPEPARG
ncbi:Gfo/Idh/MocA family oxidoreductase [Micromonospora sp. WMMD1102]|uniref:Gfo/Idh/MocA family protein n=1 Tax=Micromonospora sp. WMMD1102 TaxID=3016105 RepID=UPI00241591E0|nr:Gfo/Idh/MocA family oxidoreductase [Micromonospora sp. WMMD1102]MDG4788690.1 Gfo/Idh/MocA family oxidoreductase [Micromonospora sp. WMMD1102]